MEVCFQFVRIKTRLYDNSGILIVKANTCLMQTTLKSPAIITLIQLATVVRVKFLLVCEHF